jgi:hypothetical protein
MTEVVSKSGIPRSTAYSMVSTTKPALPTDRDVLVRFLDATGASSTQVEDVLRAWAWIRAYRAGGQPSVQAAETTAAPMTPFHDRSCASGGDPQGETDRVSRHTAVPVAQKAASAACRLSLALTLASVLTFLGALISVVALRHGHPRLAVAIGTLVGMSVALALVPVLASWRWTQDLLFLKPMRVAATSRDMH